MKTVRRRAIAVIVISLAVAYVAREPVLDAQGVVENSVLKNRTFAGKTEEIAADNGKIKAYLMSEHSVPLVSCSFGFDKSGTAYEKKTGAALLAADIMASGAGAYSRQALRDVMKEKGIEYAIEAVSEANRQIGWDAYHLIVYGQVDRDQKEWFDKLVENNTGQTTWEYGGLVPFDSSTEILRTNFALLFPTYYEGEGFAGTLIDAFASGVPVIASDWRYNAEIVENGVTGKIFRTQNTRNLVEMLVWAYEHQRLWNRMKDNCLEEAAKYLPQEAIRQMRDAILV